MPYHFCTSWEKSLRMNFTGQLMMDSPTESVPRLPTSLALATCSGVTAYRVPFPRRWAFAQKNTTHSSGFPTSFAKTSLNYSVDTFKKTCRAWKDLFNRVFFASILFVLMEIMFLMLVWPKGFWCLSNLFLSFHADEASNKIETTKISL